MQTSVWIYACAIIGQGGSMFFGGVLGRRIGPRWTTLLGSFLSRYVYWKLLDTTLLLVLGLGIEFHEVWEIKCPVYTVLVI